MTGKRAITRISRKLLHRIYHVWLKKEHYRKRNSDLENTLSSCCLLHKNNAHDHLIRIVTPVTSNNLWLRIL